jgi:hypothetical protein
MSNPGTPVHDSAIVYPFSLLDPGISDPRAAIRQDAFSESACDIVIPDLELVSEPRPLIADMSNDVPLLLDEAAETLEVAAKAVRTLKTVTLGPLWESLANTADDAIERAGGAFSDAMHVGGFKLHRE